MPTNIALRSPQFKQIQIPVSGVASAKCVINIVPQDNKSNNMIINKDCIKRVDIN